MLGEPGWKTRKMIACFACAIAANTSFMSGGVGGLRVGFAVCVVLGENQMVVTAPSIVAACEFVSALRRRLSLRAVVRFETFPVIKVGRSQIVTFDNN